MTSKTTKRAGQRMPALRVHKQSGRCYGRFSGETVWFGSRSDPATQQRFDTYLAQWLARGRKNEERREDGLAVSSVVARYLRHLEEKHDAKWHRNNFCRIDQALKPLLELHGSDPASEFSPLRLKAVRQAMILKGRLCRSEINDRVQVVRRCFRWAVSEEFVPAVVFHGLQAVDHIRVGEYGVREGRVREPVAEDVVFATMRYLHPVAAALVEILWRTGARPSEICGLCPQDIDRSGDVWIAERKEHKSAKKGKVRELGFGPLSQEVLRRFLDRVPTPAPGKPIFSPALAMAEHRQLLRARRQSKVWDSHAQRYAREAAGRKRAEYADRYTAATLRKAIERAVIRANQDRRVANKKGQEPPLSMLTRWTPYQLRHAALTRIRSECGLEAAKAVGGHSSVVMTEGYSQQAERELARRIAQELG